MCNHIRGKVLHTRYISKYTKRLRQCLKCGKRYVTVEIQCSITKGKARNDAVNRAVELLK